MYAPAERADTLPPFLIYPYVYSVVMPVYLKTLKLAHDEPLRSGQEVKGTQDRDFFWLRL